MWVWNLVDHIDGGNKIGVFEIRAYKGPKLEVNERNCIIRSFTVCTPHLIYILFELKKDPNE